MDFQQYGKKVRPLSVVGVIEELKKELRGTCLLVSKYWLIPNVLSYMLSVICCSSGSGLDVNLFFTVLS